MALAAALLPAAGDRLRAALGLPAFALGAASAPFFPPHGHPGPSLWITGALLLLGPALLAGATWRARARVPGVVGVLSMTGVALLGAMIAAWPTLRDGGILPTLVTAGALALGGWLVWLVGERAGLGRASRWLDGRIAPPRAQLADPDSPRVEWTGWFLAAGLLSTLFGPYLSLVFLGAILVAVTGHLRGRRRGTTGRVPVLWLAAPVLAAAWWLTATVAGPGLQAVSSLPDAPFSAPAELLLSAAVAVAAALLTGLWPLHGLLPGGGVALAAGALLLRLGLPAWPLGMEHWQPLAVAIGVASAWWAVGARRVPLAAGGLAFAASFTTPAAGIGAWCLLVFVAFDGRLPGRLAALLLAGGGYLVVAPLLGAQVVYTVLFAAAATALLGSLAAESPGS
jgi:hypothetical protein